MAKGDDANMRPSTEEEVSIFGDVPYPAGSESFGGRPFVNKVWAVYECLHRPVNNYYLEHKIVDTFVLDSAGNERPITHYMSTITCSP
jgi:hypothetical protein